MGNFGQYDPGRMSLVVCGIEITGFHTGEMVKCSRNNPTWKHEKGGQGDGVRTRSRDKSGTIVFTLQSTSPSNKLLLARALLDESTGRGFGSALGKDSDGNGMVQAENCWIEKPADLTWADEHSPREWTVVCDELEFVEQ